MLQYPVGPKDQFTNGQTLAIAATAYICTIMFTILLLCALHNTWNYLIKQGKWKVFSLSMFYFLTLLCASLRIIVCIFCVVASQTLNLPLTIMPCVVKVCIGLVQISVMVEISIRIKENVSMFTMVNSQVNLRSTENMMDDIIASKNVTKVKILVFQVLVFLITLVSLVYSATMSTIYNRNKYAPM